MIIKILDWKRINKYPNVSKYDLNWLKYIPYKNAFESNKSDTISN